MQRGEGLTTIIKMLTTEAGPVTVRQLAERAGMTPQVLCKWKKKLKRTGLIKLTKGKKKPKTIALSKLGKEVLSQFVHELQTNADHPAVQQKLLDVFRRELRLVGRPKKATLKVKRKPEHKTKNKPVEDEIDYSWVLLAQGFCEGA